MTSASTWNRGRIVRVAPAVALAAALAFAPRPARGADEEGCLGCHGLPGFSLREGGGARGLALAPDAFDGSAHGDLGCRECHAGVASIPHGETREVGCGQPCHGRTIGGKPFSHDGIYWAYTASVHGSTKVRRIGCLVCHPAPAKGAAVERDKLGEARRCAACHRGSRAVQTWFTDRHFMALAAGNARAPSCPDCHSAHKVLPASAADSTVSPGRLRETCSSGALAPEGGGPCHGSLSPAAALGATMSPLPRRGAGATLLGLVAGALCAGLVVRAGIGLVRSR